MSRSIVVLGGGISGLAATYYLTRIPTIKRIVLVDKSPRLGGWIQSSRYPCGTVDEHGPHSIRTAGIEGANTLSLIEDLGIDKSIIPVDPKTLRGRLVYVKGGMHWLPGTPQDLFAIRKPFQYPIILAVLKDFWKPRLKIEDESVHAFFTRRFSEEIANYIMDPMCRGICGGNSREISVRSLLPDVYNAEQQYGSVVKGMSRLQGPTPKDGLALRAKEERWGAYSFTLGLQTLVDALVEEISSDRRVSIYENEDNVKLSCQDGEFTVDYAEGSTKAEHLFSCVPAKSLSRLMSPVEPAMATILSEIPVAHLVSCTLEFPGDLLKHRAFGYLVPSSEDSRVLGTIFDSACFPQHDGQYTKKTRVTCLMGGRWFNEVFGDIKKVDPSVYTEAAIEASRNHLGITVAPSRHLTNVLKNCIPQYMVGHHSTVSKLKDLIKEKDLKISLLGASFEGISVNHCIHNSKKAVEKYAKSQGIL